MKQFLQFKGCTTQLNYHADSEAKTTKFEECSGVIRSKLDERSNLRGRR
jgi:hypothetical protein